MQKGKAKKRLLAAQHRLTTPLHTSRYMARSRYTLINITVMQNSCTLASIK